MHCALCLRSHKTGILKCSVESHFYGFSPPFLATLSESQRSLLLAGQSDCKHLLAIACSCLEIVSGAGASSAAGAKHHCCLNFERV